MFLKEVILNLKQSLKRTLKISIFYKVFVSSFSLFLISYIMKISLNMAGYDFIVTMNDYKNFFTSLPGIIAIILMIIIITIVTLFEIGNQIICLGTKKQKSIHIFHHIKKIIGPGVVLGVIFSTLILPFLQLGLGSSILPVLAVPGFIMDVIKNDPLYTFLYFLFSIFAMYIFAKYIFVYHYIIIENLNFKESFKKSKKTTKNKKIKVILGIFVIQFIVIIVTTLLSIVMTIVIVSLQQSSNTIVEIIKLVLEITLPLILLIPSIIIPLAVISTLTVLLRRWDSEIKEYEYPESRLKTPKILIVTIIIIIIIPTYDFINKTIKYADISQNKTTVTVHRGGGNYGPQNTKKSLEYGISTNSEYVEIDIQMTLDGVLVLNHDASLKNSSKIDKNIQEITYEELKQYTISSEPYITFAESLDVIKGKIKMNAEIKLDQFGSLEKDENKFTKRQKEMTFKILQTIKEKNMENDVVITSFDYNTIKTIKENESKIRVGLITNGAFGNIEHLKIDFYSIEETFLTNEFVMKAHRLGREVHVWTLNSEESISKAIENSVDSIITDEPLEAKRIIGEYGND